MTTKYKLFTVKSSVSFMVFILLFGVYSCNTDAKVEKAQDSYKFFNLEQGGWKSKSISQNFSNITYTATLVPIQYYIIKEEGAHNMQKIDSIYQKHKMERIVEMEFSQDLKDDLLKSKYTNLDYESSVEYMAFSIEKDFMAITQKGDTLQCSGVSFERNFKLAPFKRLLLHFGNIPENEQIQLVYQDRLFGNGMLKFKFKETPLKL